MDFDASTSDFPLDLLEQFQPVKLLGAGAMGAVFLAKDLTLGREVAVKVMATRPEPEMMERFKREAASLARIKHPNVLEVYDHGVVGAGPYIVMEYLLGRPIDQARLRDPTRTMLEVAAGLEEIHRNGMVHRDLKPDNILYTDDGRPVIVDFGLVFDPRRTKLTRTGAVVGTVAFMAPEVLRTRPISPAADWYSWGVTLFALHEKRFPYTLVDLLEVAKGEPLPPLKFERLNPTSPHAYLLERALSERPEKRPVTRAMVVKILEEAPPEEELAAPGPPLGEEDETTLEVAPLDDLTSEASRSALVRRIGGRRGISLLAGAALVLLVGAGSFLMTPGDPGEVPAGSPLPADLADRVRAEVEAARGQLMDRFGSVVTRGGPDRDVRPFLDPDPRRWGYQVRHLPGLRELYVFLGRGGRVGDLPPPLREDLQALDPLFRGLGLPPPLSPYAHLAPDPEPFALPEAFTRGRFEAMGLPDPAVGWAAAALRNLARAAELHTRMHREYRAALGGAPPPGFPRSVWETPGARLRRFPNFYELIREVSGRTVHRKALRPYLEDGTLLLHHAFASAARSVAEEPATRDALALLFSDLGTLVTPFFYGHVFFLEPTEVLGGEPGTPAGWLLLGDVVRLTRAVRRRLGDDPTERLLRVERDAYARTTSVEEGADATARRRAEMGLFNLLRSLGEEPADPGRLREAFAREVDRILAFPEPLRTVALVEVATQGGPGALAPGLRARLREGLEAGRASGPPTYRDRVDAALAGL